LPTGDFDLKDNPTTQLRVGVKQAFPRGNTRHFQSLKRSDNALAEQRRTLLTRQQILRAVRLYYLEAFYQQKSVGILKENRALFVRLLKNSEDTYRVGISRQQAVLQAQLELSRLDDQIYRTKNNRDSNLSQLSKWVPAVMNRPLAKHLPALSVIDDKALTDANLIYHPVIAIDDANVQAAKHDINIAEQQYKPGWNVGVEYRKRFGDQLTGERRDDLLAAMLSMDLPIFTDKRQDKRLLASQHHYQAEKSLRDEHLRDLAKQLKQVGHDWAYLKQRELGFKNSLLPNAIENTKAAIRAYQSGVIEFSTLMEAHSVELKTRLENWRVRVDRSKAHARLLFLVAPTDNSNKEVHGE
ncbi:MAG: TolC family protein, partial [Cycloclasticus sp.]|nr:TolC family protein [Cycloclasticus sp.]